MPRVKIDYVVSFSSEDPESPAASLLAREAGRARWLCARGAAHASVVLQLARACAISSVTIGAHQAALVEVLVGRSETPSEPYQVLVPSSVFLGPRESRGGGGGGGAGAERVRTFAREALAAGARDQRWDRVRLVATQPYNKHCKYGISFVHLFEPEQAPPPPAPPLQQEEEEAFRPGELFAQHRRAAAAAADTGAQIRQASSQALRSEPEAAPPPARGTPRAGLRAGSTSTVCHNQRTGLDKTPTKEKQTSTSKTLQNNIDGDRKDNGKIVTPRTNDALSRRDENRKRSHSDKNDKKPQAREDAETCGEGGEGGGARPLQGVVFVLSGYENPRRARLRELGAALGARPRRAWGPGCTHLVCAFPNTPKLRGVRAAAGGARVPAVRGEWLEACARAGRRLPWRAHATDPAQRTPADHTSDCDTDDEIEEVLRQQERRRAAPRAAVDEPSGGDGVQPATDGRMQGDVAAESDSCDTEEEPAPERGAGGGGGGGGGEVPAALGALALALCACGAAPLDARLVARYARAYGGLLLTSEEAESRGAPYYVLCGGGCGGGGRGARGARLRADWLWACHAARALVPADEYLLPPLTDQRLGRDE